ncbi:hypothetical protein BJ322DRAFT_493540 [Thelephora terrestris]|uniref:BTB domain-containing protein n=1 Tax=Thelephora terrestris TaxID=56493 RepID=A0A9P6H2Y7_9AGAM|nr:hypothetical protein BJ322DRAFT_493540 [Thelephora terrestris]
MAATLSFREALNEGIASGTFVDTKIILFSRKDSSGRVHGPKELYASSHVLKSIPHFSLLLFGNFREAESQDFGDTFDDGEYSFDYGYCSDSDLEDDNETAADVLKGVLKRADTVKEAFRKVTPQQGSLKRVLRSDSLRSLRSGTFRKPPRERYSERSYKGKVIRIPDVAFITFQAFLLYLYTGEMEFAPTKSGANQTWGIGLRDSLHDDVPRPSPRSIYRLADKYDVPELRTLALCRIRDELHTRDIVKETFSKFASKYDEWQPPPVEHPTYWKVIKAAMVKSINQGVFFDQKYWTRHSRDGRVLRPIYFSRLITGDALRACMSMHYGGGVTATELSA